MPRSKKEHPWNYEETVARVEALIETIERGSLPLEEVFERFAEAVAQLRQCEDFLQKGQESMELSIEQLTDRSTEEIDF
jgi:exodeoxyribonuclease VII small subunit